MDQHATVARDDPPVRNPPELFGHPIGLLYIVTAEALAFFAYTGAQALLTLFLTQRLFTPGHAEHVIGLASYRAGIDTAFGRTTLIGLASQTFGLFTGLAYALPLAGALLADRWLGQRRVTIGGLALLVLGYALVVAEPTFLIGLVLVIVATGGFKSNLLGMIGRLYAPDDSRAARGYGVYLISINIGSFASPLVCGGLAQTAGWGWGFVPLAVAALLALAVTAAGMRHLPADTVRTRRNGDAAPAKLGSGDGRIVAVLLLLIALDVLFIGTYNQSFDILPVWADAHVDRRLFGLDLPATLFSSLDGLFTILGTAGTMRLWAWQAKRGREPRATTKFAIGILLAGAAFLVLAAGAAIQPKTPILFPIVYFALVDLAITWVDLLVLSLVSRLSPPAIASTMLSLYLLSTMVSNFLVGWLGTFYDRLSAPGFWGMHGAIVLAVIPILLLTRRYISPTLREGEAASPA